MITDVSEMRTDSIIRAMMEAVMTEAVRISETSVIIYLTTRQYIPDDSKLHDWDIFGMIRRKTLWVEYGKDETFTAMYY
jgi:hypothetical protein